VFGCTLFPSQIPPMVASRILPSVLALALALGTGACADTSAAAPDTRLRVLLDTDANNELDDQHAIAYMLFNGDYFEVEGITINRTSSGGGIDNHVAEAERIVKLSGLDGRIPVVKGADGAFEEIADQLHHPDHDAAAAVDFIIRRAHEPSDRPLVLVPVGKLTNIALALKKDPSIAPRVKILWLGSNYPEPGEHNQVNDEPALNYILDSDVEFDIAIVRYGKPSGTDAVWASLAEIRSRMPGQGPEISPPVTGRHGGDFTTFGDYSVSLFENYPMDGDPPSRPLFDMAAVAILKNPAWANARTLPAPILVDGRWVDRPENPRQIVIWEDFDREAIINDFFHRVENPVLAE
jgi:purine nucleosidase